MSMSVIMCLMMGLSYLSGVLLACTFVRIKASPLMVFLLNYLVITLLTYATTSLLS